MGRVATRKYLQTPKGKAKAKEYQQSDRGKAAKKRYQQSGKYKISKRKYLASKRGRLTQRYQGMKRRCYDPSYPGYKFWGGRGIECRFLSGKEFADYVLNELQVDPRGLEIHRIDQNKHYERGNIVFLPKEAHMKLHNQKGT